MRSIDRGKLSELSRFLVSGTINTGITYIIYVAALQVIGYRSAYTLSYLSGILISYCLNARYVFRRRMALRSFLPYPLVYLVQYLLGIGALSLFVEYLHMDRRIAPLVVVVCLLPVTFILTRIVIRTLPSQE